MKTHALTQPRATRRAAHSPGLAIVVVVSLMALLMLLVLAFLLTSSTNRNISNTDVAIRQANSISEAATATVISDLLEEFAADTPPVDASATDRIQKIYAVANPASMVPSRTLKNSSLINDPNFTNLVKQSADGVNFSVASRNGAAGVRASSVSTSAKDLDQRFIPEEFWSKPGLFCNQASLSANQVPDWIYLDRSGGNPGAGGGRSSPTDAIDSLTSNGEVNPKFVVGRYAWQIYDVGGLLDTTVALHDPNETSPGKDAKDSPFWAVANSLPGAPTGLGKTLSNWRHSVGKVAAPKPNRLIEDWAEPNGWNRVFSDGTNTDQTFLTRQDLIKFQRENAGDFPPELLSYFTHSNFSLNQSALRPAPNRPKISSQGNGGNDASGQDDGINPSFLELRSTISEQTSATKPTVPVASKRFPLDRLDLVVPSPPQAALVSRFFGLAFSSGQWSYSGNTIRRLSDVATQNREPDLFELLKGTVHAGSLGMSGLGSDSVLALDKSLNYHVVQIVANLIDQWDSDSFPTIINFDGRQFIGIEDLPRIYYVRTACYRQKIIPPATFVGSAAGPPPANFGNIYEAVYLRQPILWNPHAESPTTVAKPTEFRIIAISNQAANSAAADVKCQVYNGSNGAAPWNNLPTGPINNFTLANGPNFSVAPGPQRWDASSAFITFNVAPTGSAPATFRQPYPLKSPNYPAGSNAVGKEVHPLINDTELSFPDNESKSNQAIGFLIGKVWCSEATFCLDPGLVIDNGIRYELQYSKGGTWTTYDVMKTEPFTGQDRTSFPQPMQRHFASWFRIDPRTSRLGILSTNNFRGWPGANNVWTWRNGETGAPDQGDGQYNKGNLTTPPQGWRLDGGKLFPRFFQVNLPNGRGSYTDADGITRPAMGATASGINGLPLANPNGSFLSRPRILNRAFRSIAELGYVFRDTPWRQLDLSHAASEDGKLLDVFCLHSNEAYESPRISKGRINLNSAPAEVLAALFQGTSKGIANSGPLSKAESLALGTALRRWVTAAPPQGGPLRQRADLIGSTIGNTSSGFMDQVDTVIQSSDRPITERREAVVRALADSSDTRTWNLMIDLVTQSGQLRRGASSLEQFISRAQVHHWVFLSIDRFTGEILHLSSEPVDL